MGDLGAILHEAIWFVGALNEQAAQLDGLAAFVLGLLTWFSVEQAVRRMAGALRLAIIVAAVGASGVGVATLFGAFDGQQLLGAAP